MKSVYHEATPKYDGDDPLGVHVDVLMHESNDAPGTPNLIVLTTFNGGSEYRVRQYANQAQLVREAIAWFDTEVEAMKVKELVA